MLLGAAAAAAAASASAATTRRLRVGGIGCGECKRLTQ